MYGENPKNREPVWPELDVDCPTRKAKKGEPCGKGDPAMGETTELPHNRRVQAAGQEVNPARRMKDGER